MQRHMHDPSRIENIIPRTLHRSSLRGIYFDSKENAYIGARAGHRGPFKAPGLKAQYDRRARMVVIVRVVIGVLGLALGYGLLMLVTHHA